MDAATLDRLLAPLIADPANSAVMLDVDGTLSPITMRAENATVPDGTRKALAQVAARYGAVACITGRQCVRARQMVGLDEITYFGNHGSELMAPGSDVVELVIDDATQWRERVHEFGARAFERFELTRLGVRSEDKGAILGLHWRGVPDEQAAEDVMHEVAFAAQADGLAVHWAKKILEIRPLLEFSKGTAVSQIVDERKFSTALFVGDDFTDIHAFDALDDAKARGRIKRAIKVGVDSDEVPAEVAEAADIMLTGTKGVEEMLELLSA